MPIAHKDSINVLDNKLDPFPTDAARGRDRQFEFSVNVSYRGGKPAFRLNTVPSAKWPLAALPYW